MADEMGSSHNGGLTEKSTTRKWNMNKVEIQGK